jgi:hypothetical protein
MPRKSKKRGGSSLGDAMFRRCVVLAVFLLMVPVVEAQGQGGDPERITSLQQAMGVGNAPTKFVMKRGGRSKLKTSDGEPHWGKSAGVVIVRSNTDEFGFRDPCVVADEQFDFNGFDLLRASLQNLIFRPSPKRSSILEIIWSGQVIVDPGPAPLPGNFDQRAFFKCTVSQKDESVPCSGTLEMPLVAEDLTGAGISEWVNYHGYVEFNPKREVTVEIEMLATVETSVVICGDTLTLKY